MSIEESLGREADDVYRWSNGPGDRYERHEHTYTKVLYCVTGSIDFALDDLRGDMGLDLRRNAEAVQSIRKAVIEGKIALSEQPSIKLDVELADGKRYLREVTREQFEQLIQPVIDRTVGPCKQAMKDAGLKPEQVRWGHHWHRRHWGWHRRRHWGWHRHRWHRRHWRRRYW